MGALRDRYLETETSQFVLHGNVHDVVIAADRVWDMPEFLDAFFAPSDKVVVHYDPGRGVWFPDDRHAARAARALLDSRFLDPEKIAPRGVDRASDAALAARMRDELGLERDPDVALPVLEALLVRPDTPCAIIIHYAELIAPHGDPASLGFDDRTASARLHRWSLSHEITRNDNVVLLLTSTLSDLATRLTRNPRVGAFRIDLPGAVERAKFLARLRPDLDADRGEQLTRVTAGLQLRQIKDLMSTVEGGPDPLPLEAIWARKREILEQECFGLIEVLEPDHDFAVVGGNEPIKNALKRVAEHVRQGRRNQVPMGILLVGPMGTGKSFVAEAFAKESGLAAIRLKNFRDKWVGSTEANLEKILNVVEGLGEILVIIDEGDRSMGGEAEGDSGVNSRVIARLKEFMSDPSHRGRIVFVMMTNRPDKLDTDMKRPGRFDLKIPFFSPQNAQERAAILRAQVRRHGIEADLPDEQILPLLDGLHGYAAADLEALLLLAYDDFASGVLPADMAEKPATLTTPFLAQAVHDFMPSREQDMIVYMELLAVQEASNRRLLPDRFRDITLDELATRLAEARGRALRHRA
jgi:hypothetical protein